MYWSINQDFSPLQEVASTHNMHRATVIQKALDSINTILSSVVRTYNGSYYITTFSYHFFLGHPVDLFPTVFYSGGFLGLASFLASCLKTVFPSTGMPAPPFCHTNVNDLYGPVID